MRILAICTANIARSILFEHVFSQVKGLEVKSCGMYPARQFNPDALMFYDQRGIKLTKTAPERYDTYQHLEPFDFLIYLSDKSLDVPNVGFGEPLKIQSEFPDPLTGATTFSALYNRYKEIADNITEKSLSDRFSFVTDYLNWVRMTRYD